MKKLLSVSLSLALTLALLASCGSKPAAPASSAAPAPSASASESAPAGEKGMPLTSNIKNMSIGGAGTSGTFYIMAAGYGDLITDQLGINTVAEVTAGSVENVKLLADKSIEMGVVQLDVTMDALAGTGKFDAPVPLKVLAPMYPNVVQIVTLADSEIKTVQDLKGKRVSVGSPGSGILATNEIILSTLGLSMDDIDPQYLSFAETTEAFRNGSVDAVIVNTAAPSGFLVDLETTHPIKFVPLTDAEIKLFTDGFPFYAEAVIPGKTYSTIAEDYKTFAVWIVLATTDDLPDDVAYNVTKVLMENNEALKAVHAVGAYTVPENAAAIKGVDYHPGSAQYFADMGVAIK